MSPSNRLQLRTEALRLDVRSFRVYDAMHQPFVVTLTGLADGPEVDLDAVVGESATFELYHRSSRHRSWSGIVRRCELLAARPVAHVWLELVPPSWLLSQRTNYRIFQDVTELDVVERVLAEWRIEAIVRVDRGALRRSEVVVQYGESDHDLVCRMLERAGISSWFEDVGGTSRWVLCDAPQAALPRTLPFRPDVTERVGDDYVSEVTIARSLRPGRYVLRDKDFRRPPLVALDGEAGDVPDAATVERHVERFHYVPGALQFDSASRDTPAADDRIAVRTDLDEGRRRARMRLDAKRADARVFQLETTAVDLAVGDCVVVADHPSRLMREPVLVTGVTLAGTPDGRWQVSAHARTTRVPYRPALATPAPVVRGIEAATVVGPAGEEIHTDEFGRARVQFHWDREGRRDEHSSAWLHASEPWAGVGYGGVNLPRGGQEVLVDFMGGDPDRPVIVGRIYTALQPVPYPLPDNKTKTGWKSSSTQGTGGFNELMFDDAAGEELVRMQAERDLDTKVKRDETRTIHRDRDTRVTRDDARRVTGDQRQVVEGSATKIVRGTSDTSIKGPVQSFVGDGERSTVGANRGLFVGAHRTTETDGTRSVRSEQLRKVEAAAHHYRVANKSAAALAPHQQRWTIGKSKLELDGGQVTWVAKAIRLEVNYFSAHAALAELAAERVTLKGGEVNVVSRLVALNGPGKPAARVGEPAPDMVRNGAGTVFVGGPSLPVGAVVNPDGSIVIGKNLTVIGNREHIARTLADLGRMSQTKRGRALLRDIQRGDGEITITDGRYDGSKVTPGWWPWLFGGRGDVDVSYDPFETYDVPSDGILYGNLDKANRLRKGEKLPADDLAAEKEYLRERGWPRYRTDRVYGTETFEQRP